MKPFYEFNGRNFYYVSMDTELTSLEITSNCALLIINSDEIEKVKMIVDRLTLNSAGAIAFGGSHAHSQISKLLEDYNDRWERIGLLPYLFDELELSELVENSKYVCMPNNEKFDQWTSTYVIEIGCPMVGPEAILIALQSK